MQAYLTSDLLPSNAKITPMLKQWLEAKKRSKDAILLFRMGDFYELFADDAVKAAPILELALTSRDKNTENDKVAMAGFPHHAAPLYISKLIAAGLKVAICDQLEDPKLAKGIVKRDITRIVTPGTVVDDDGLKPNNNNYLVAICFSKNCYGISALDVSTGGFTSTRTYSKDVFFDELNKLAPAEVLASEQEWPFGFLNDLKNSLNQERACLFEFRQKLAQKNSVLKNTGILDDWFLEEENESAVKSAELILEYIEDTQGGIPKHIVSPKPYSIDAQLMIDATSRRHLDLQGFPHETRKEGTLLWAMDKTCTAMGARMLARWLLSPSTDVDIIKKRHDQVQGFLNEPFVYKKIQDLLKHVYDLERLAAKVTSSRINPRELAYLRNSLEKIPSLLTALQNCQSDELKTFLNKDDDLQDIFSILDKALIFDPPFSLKEGGIFKPKYDSILDELVELSMGGRDQIAAIENREKEATGISSLKIKYTRVFGYYIEITKTHLHKVPEHYKRKQTVALGERYVTPELIRLEELVSTAEIRRQNKELELFEALRQRLSQESARILRTAHLLAQLDTISAFARVADERNFVRPKILPMSEKKIWIEEGRHPIIEILSEKRNETFVPNNIELNGDQNQLILITGPNMAGKSTIMRQVALIQLLSQAGSFVPAKNAELSVCDRIFTRVGASDDLVGARSTFMVEMSETAHILKHATEYSLVVLDEIGRGTSTFDGLSLAFAVAEYLHNQVKARTLFATHYHELVSLSQNLKSVQNMQVAVHEANETITFLYRLIKGAAEQSYGIHVARLAGLPAKVLKRAEEILNSLESDDKKLQFISPTKVEDTRIPQLDLFSKPLFNEEKVGHLLNFIADINLNNTTPLEAFRRLEKLQSIVKAI